MTPGSYQLMPATRPEVHGEVAIIGMACRFPRAGNLTQFWKNIVTGVDAVDEVDPRRWNSDVHFDPSGADGRIYCKRGGYLDASFVFNPLRHGTMPRAVEGAEPDQFLVLRTVYEAIEDAGYCESRLSGVRSAFILGRGNYLGAGAAGLVQRGVVTEQTLQMIAAVRPDLSAEHLDRLRAELRAQSGVFGPDAAPGMIPNISTGRAANRLDLTGPTYTVDAACASSLIALEIAVRGLLTHEYDLGLAGGVHVFTDVPFLQIFCAMGALSRTSVIRPFDRNCDGTIPGEGVGILMLKRLEDARADGDRVYAVIRGIGTSSDGRALSVTAPRLEGEVLALQRAYEMAGVSPDTVTLIEAHGTGTPVGDATELEALRKVFGISADSRPSVALGSVKSMIGHAMPAAGAAALIKTALALYHGVLPPTLHCGNPHELLGRDDSLFYLNTQTRPWMHSCDAHPRRAGVNAFGFGGVNAHAILEEYQPVRRTSTIVATPGLPDSSVEAEPTTLLRDWECELCIIEADSRESLVQQVARLREYALAATGVRLCDLAFTLSQSLRGAEHRLAIVAVSMADLADKLDFAHQRLRSPDRKPIKELQGVYYLHDSPARGGRLAFLFPGLGSQYVNLMSELCVHFPEVRRCFENADHTVRSQGGVPLSADLFPPPTSRPEALAEIEKSLARIERANPAVTTANGAMCILLDRLGIQADMMTGHSSGEWVALPAAGMVPVEEFVAAMSRLSRTWEELHHRASVPRQVMLSVGADRKTVEALAAGLHTRLEIANDNCHHQVVVVVVPEEADKVEQALRGRGIFVERLPYAHGYHTEPFTFVTEQLRQLFGTMTMQAPRARLYSSTTTRPYPEGVNEVIEQLSVTFARPLRFRETIEAMYADGARIFLEVGPRSNLTAFVDDIFRSRPHAAIATNTHRKSALGALLHALAQLAALHVPMKLNRLYERRVLRALKLDSLADRPVDEASEPGAMEISLCGPQLKIPPHLLPNPTVRSEPSEAALVAFTGSAGDRETTSGKDDRVASTLENVAQLAKKGHVPVNDASSYQYNPTRLDQAPTNRRGETAVLADASLVLQAHFRVMEKLLRTNEEILTAYLAGTASSAPSGPLTHEANQSRLSTREFEASASSGDGRADSSGFRADGQVPQDRLPIPNSDRPESGIDTEGRFPTAQTPAHGRTVQEAAPRTRSIKEFLLSIVSDRTGYPPDMLDLDLDLEADLGIDSIKRVEILGALQQAGASNGFAGSVDMEKVAGLKTLRQIIDFLESAAAPSGAASEPSEVPRESGLPTHASPPPLTLGGTVQHLVPGREVRVVREVTVDEDLFLNDHCFDPDISEADPHRERLCVVPLTVSLELMAEVAALTAPGMRPVRARNVQASRWIEVEPGCETVRLAIHAVRPDPFNEVRVSIWRDGLAHSKTREETAPLAEATMVLAKSYPPPPPVDASPLVEAKPAICTADQMYANRHMFHGPRFRGVVAFDAVGKNGLDAQLEVLPTDNLLRSNNKPNFYFDPFLLDAAGQLVGYWPLEYETEGFVLFPIRIQEVSLYQENLAPGRRARCILRVVEMNQRQLRANMDILAPDGSLWMRVTGWEDWRFYWDKTIYDFWRFPDRFIATKQIDLAVEGAEGPVECRQMGPAGDRGSGIWENLWAHLILSRRELSEFRRIEPASRRSQWLFERTAAKDAVRAWIRRRHGLELYPADVEIAQDGLGGSSAGGCWLPRVGGAPRVSISFEDQVAVAVAGSAAHGPIGLALGSISARATSFDAVKFTEHEQAVVCAANGKADRDEWLARAVYAKEAAARAAGRSDSVDQCPLVIQRIDPQRQAIVVGHGSPRADSSAGNSRADGWWVQCHREGDFMVAVAVAERESHAFSRP